MKICIDVRRKVYAEIVNFFSVPVESKLFQNRCGLGDFGRFSGSIGHSDGDSILYVRKTWLSSVIRVNHAWLFLKIFIHHKW